MKNAECATLPDHAFYRHMLSVIKLILGDGLAVIYHLWYDMPQVKTVVTVSRFMFIDQDI